MAEQKRRKIKKNCLFGSLNVVKMYIVSQKNAIVTKAPFCKILNNYF